METWKVFLLVSAIYGQRSISEENANYASGFFCLLMTGNIIGNFLWKIWG